MVSPEINLTLDDAVAEVLGLLTGLDLQYAPELDRYNAITRQLNRALRSVAVEHEWSHYSDVASLGNVSEGDQIFTIPSTLRPRIINDDSIRLVDTTGNPRVWGYFLPRDALHKYRFQPGLRASVVRDTLHLSRPIYNYEEGWELQIPVMREPTMFRLPEQPEDPNLPLVTVPQAIRDQPIDFSYPDLVILRAAYFYAQTDPVMQPRVQTLEAQYKDMMYQLIERDSRNTDSPLLNDFLIPIQGSLDGPDVFLHVHPHADERRF